MSDGSADVNRMGPRVIDPGLKVDLVGVDIVNLCARRGGVVQYGVVVAALPNRTPRQRGELLEQLERHGLVELKRDHYGLIREIGLAPAGTSTAR